MAISLTLFHSLNSYARNGYRLIVQTAPEEKSKTLWAGFGNSAGLHNSVSSIIFQKWSKSGPSFQKKLVSLPAGTIVSVFSYRNITRDRGEWRSVTTRIIDDAPAAKCYHLNAEYASSCDDCGEDMNND